MVSILVGLVFVGAGFWGLIRWFPDFINFVQGFGPLSLILGGLVAVVVGISSLSFGRSDGKKN